MLENGVFVTNVKVKADTLDVYFVEQCCTIATGSSLPRLLPKCNSIMENIHIDRGKVLQLIRALDSKKASGSDSISASMIKICDMSIVELLCLILEKCLETGSYPSIWKRLMLFQYTKKIVDKINAIIDLFLYCLFLVKF